VQGAVDDGCLQLWQFVVTIALLSVAGLSVVTVVLRVRIDRVATCERATPGGGDDRNQAIATSRTARPWRLAASDQAVVRRTMPGWLLPDHVPSEQAHRVSVPPVD
jgi:hypothetical protein